MCSVIGVLTLLALLCVKLRGFEFLGTLWSGRLELAMEGGKAMVIAKPVYLLFACFQVVLLETFMDVVDFGKASCDLD
jgi:hypothetical protein